MQPLKKPSKGKGACTAKAAQGEMFNAPNERACPVGLTLLSVRNAFFAPASEGDEAPISTGIFALAKVLS